jgi:hypothetical protein
MPSAEIGQIVRVGLQCILGKLPLDSAIIEKLPNRLTEGHLVLRPNLQIQILGSYRVSEAAPNLELNLGLAIAGAIWSNSAAYWQSLRPRVLRETEHNLELWSVQASGKT